MVIKLSNVKLCILLETVINIQVTDLKKWDRGKKAHQYTHAYETKPH